MEKTLTVFTPTFNRAYCLDKCYNSLVNQTQYAYNNNSQILSIKNYSGLPNDENLESETDYSYYANGQIQSEITWKNDIEDGNH